MSAQPRHSRPTRLAATPIAPRTAPRRPALPSGQLRALVLAHLRAHPGLDLSPAEIANALGRPKSRGAVINACKRLVALGLATRTQQTPQRYRAAAQPRA
jgi:MarR family